MTDFLMGLSLFSLVLTIGAYQVGIWLRSKWNHPICNPILIAVILVVVVLVLTGIPVEDYQKGAAGMQWLLTPATVCLAVPLYEHVKTLKKNLPAILTGIAAGTLTSLCSILLMCRLFQLDHTISVSMLPKSITTAMGIILSEGNGGIPALTTAAIITSGILGSLLASFLCKILKLQNPIAQGVAIGTASHVIGTAKANEIGPLQGAVSSLSLTIAGILTAILFPLACLFLPQ